MTKIKTAKLICCFFAIAAVVLISVYFIYGSTLANPADEADLVAALTVDNENPPTILSMASCCNGEVYVVTYFDNSFGSTSYSSVLYRKSGLYKNKFVRYGGSCTTTFPIDTLCLNGVSHNTKLENGGTRAYYYVHGIAEKQDIEYEITVIVGGEEKAIYSDTAPAGEYYLQIVSVDLATGEEDTVDMNVKR